MTLDFKMAALSIQQPWAWCIMQGYKGVENRSWNTKRRGPILIHAGKKLDMEGYRWIADNFPLLPLPEPQDFERGGIVGMASIAGVVEAPFVVALLRDGRRKEITNWFTGPFGFVLDEVKTLPFIPCKGKLGFFKPESVTA